MFRRCFALTAVLSAVTGCGPSSTTSEQTDGTTGTNPTGGPMIEPLGGDPILPPPPQDLPPSGPWRTLMESGDRLHPVVDRFGNVKDFVAWYDEQLDIECVFVPTAEGLRCLPNDLVDYYDGPDCTEPVVAVGEDVPRFIADYLEGNCAVEYVAFEVSDEERPPNPGCYGGDLEPPTAVRPAVPVDATMFVGGIRSVDESTGYGDYRLDADDGAWRIIGAAFEGNPCNLREYQGEQICLDIRAIEFGDCGQRVVACEPVSQSFAYDDCGRDVIAVHTVGLGEDAEALCPNVYGGGLAHPIGAVLDASELPASGPALLGEGQLRLRAMSDGTGDIRWPQDLLPNGPWTRLVDATLGTPCSPETTRDGVRRCVPSIGLGNDAGLYADPACTIPAYPGAREFSDPEIECELGDYDEMDPVLGWVRDESGLEHLYGVVPHAGPLYQDAGGTCRSATRPDFVPRMFRAAGGELPLDTLAALPRETLP